MKRIATVALGFVLAGCGAEVRIARLHDELEEAARAQQVERYAAIQARLTEEAASSFADNPVRALRVRTDVAESFAQWGDLPYALDLARRTVSQIEVDHDGNPDLLVPALLSLARIERTAARWSQLRETLDRITNICSNLRKESPQVVGVDFGTCSRDTYYRLDTLYRATGDEERWARAYLFSDSLAGTRRDRRGGISMLTVLGRGYAEFGAYPEALWYLNRCLDELAPLYGRGASPSPAVQTPTPGVELVVTDGAHSFNSVAPRCLDNVIEIYRRTGDERRAEDLARWHRTLWARAPDAEPELRKKVSFADHAWHSDFLTSSYANDLAFYLASKGRVEDSIRAYREAIAWIDGAVERDGGFAGEYPSGLHVDELLGLARACEKAGRWTEAEAAYERAGEIVDARFPPRSRSRLDSLAGRARCARARTMEKTTDTNRPSNLNRSRTLWECYLEVAEEIRGRDHADYALGLAGLADTLDKLGSTKQAAMARQQAATIRAAYNRRIDEVTDLPLPMSLRSPPSPAK